MAIVETRFAKHPIGCRGNDLVSYARHLLPFVLHRLTTCYRTQFRRRLRNLVRHMKLSHFMELPLGEATAQCGEVRGGSDRVLIYRRFDVVFLDRPIWGQNSSSKTEKWSDT